MHMNRAEENIREIKEYLLIPNRGLNPQMKEAENIQNKNLATF